jgi:hypothetical protein
MSRNSGTYLPIYLDLILEAQSLTFRFDLLYLYISIRNLSVAFAREKPEVSIIDVLYSTLPPCKI